MEAKGKMAIAGSGLVVAGIGWSVLGTALIAPAVLPGPPAYSKKARTA